MIASIELFEALKTKFGESEAKVIVKEIEKIDVSVSEKIEKEFDRKQNIIATKEDIANLKIEIEKGFKENLKWMVATVLACSGIIITLTKLLWKYFTMQLFYLICQSEEL